MVLTIASQRMDLIYKLMFVISLNKGRKHLQKTYMLSRNCLVLVRNLFGLNNLSRIFYLFAFLLLAVFLLLKGLE